MLYLKAGNGQVKLMFSFLRLFLLCFATSLLLLCQDGSIWLVGQVSWQAFGNWRKCLRSQSADRDSMRKSCWIASKGQGRREEMQQERWEKGRWNGGRWGLSWRIPRFCNTEVFSLIYILSHSRHGIIGFHSCTFSRSGLTSSAEKAVLLIFYQPGQFSMLLCTGSMPVIVRQFFSCW